MIQSPAIKAAFFALFLFVLALPVAADSEGGDDGSKKAAVDLFISHLRGHFDDIHDVSMRYHLHDPSLGGVIALHMTWENGKLVAAEVEENETGSDAEAASLIEAIRKWRIEGLGGVSFTIPFRITMVGSDAPEFHQRAILTGTVRDPAGELLSRALIKLIPLSEDTGEDQEVTANREGVFIRSLIPAGNWTVRCALAGYQTQIRENIDLAAGEHRILHFVLDPE